MKRNVDIICLAITGIVTVTSLCQEPDTACDIQPSDHSVGPIKTQDTAPGVCHQTSKRQSHPKECGEVLQCV